VARQSPSPPMTLPPLSPLAWENGPPWPGASAGVCGPEPWNENDVGWAFASAVHLRARIAVRRGRRRATKRRSLLSRTGACFSVQFPYAAARQIARGVLNGLS
jgi:hypothetical protein